MQREVRARIRRNHMHGAWAWSAEGSRTRTVSRVSQVALLATMLLLATCYALVSNAVRIFKKFELKEGEVVRFSDFLRALPKAVEAADEDYDEEEMTDPQKPVM